MDLLKAEGAHSIEPSGRSMLESPPRSCESRCTVAKPEKSGSVRRASEWIADRSAEISQDKLEVRAVMRTVCAALLFAAVAAQAAADWTIDTFAGQTALRDNGPAVEAQLSRPFGVAADGLGNIYIADWGNHRIRKVDSAGVITTVAGTGRPGFSGDGGPAVEAQVGWASGVAVDGSGNIYIADWGNLRIRKVDSAGVITTYAGTGERGFSGDGGPAAEARLDAPSGVAADGSGNVYFADQYNLRIRKVDSAGVITTVAGSTVSGFSGDGGPAVEAGLGSPYGVTTDGLGNVYIANRADHRIRKVDSAGVITTIAGSGLWGLSGDGGSATEARLAAPYSVAADTSGNVYIADSSNHRIRKVDSAGLITTLAGSGDNGDGGPAVEARLFGPLGVAADGSGNIYIADEDDSRIRKVNSAGVITTVAGTGQLGFSGDGGPAVEAQLYWPSGVAADGLGNVYIADQYNHRIRKVDSAGLITTLAGSGERGFSGDSGPAAEAQLNLPGGVALDTLGNVYIADTHNHRIRKVDSAGMITTVAGTGERGSSGDGGPAAEARLSFPNDVAPDTLGNVYIADSSNHRIRKVDSAGVITTVAGMAEDGFSGDSGPAVEARLSFLGGLATDGLGNIYIADRQNKRIRILKPSVGGDGEPPSGSQDNAPADHAAFNARFAGMMLEYLTAGATATMHLAEMNRFTESVEVAGVSSTYTGVYSYRRTGLNAGRLSLVYNDGDQCQVDLSFASMTAGSFASECTDDESATGSWRIVPSGDTAPSFGSAAVSNQTYDAGTAISPLTLPAATGGDGALTYGLTLSVPGLTFNASTRTLSGTPTTAGTYNMTYTVSAAGGGTATLGFAVTVNSASTPDDSDEYTSLSGWTVTAGRVQYWFFGSAGCVSINGISLNGVSYVAHTSKWQQRANADNAWTDVPGTANTGRVCAYSPTQSGQYRGVAEITVGGERGMYATSNILTVGASTGPSFGTAAVANRTYTAGTAIAHPELAGSERGGRDAHLQPLPQRAGPHVQFHLPHALRHTVHQRCVLDDLLGEGYRWRHRYSQLHHHRAGYGSAAEFRHCSGGQPDLHCGDRHRHPELAGSERRGRDAHLQPFPQRAGPDVQFHLPHALRHAVHQRHVQDDLHGERCRRRHRYP